MLRAIIAFGLSAFLLAGFAGCTGAGEATTIKVEDRPPTLRDDSGGPNIGPDGNELPPGVLTTEK